jgi:hypothetical protein
LALNEVKEPGAFMVSEDRRDEQRTLVEAKQVGRCGGCAAGRAIAERATPAQANGTMSPLGGPCFVLSLERGTRALAGGRGGGRRGKGGRGGGKRVIQNVIHFDDGSGTNSLVLYGGLSVWLCLNHADKTR